MEKEQALKKDKIRNSDKIRWDSKMVEKSHGRCTTYFAEFSLSDLNVGPRTKIKSLNKCEELEGTGQGWDGTHSGMGASVK